MRRSRWCLSLVAALVVPAVSGGGVAVAEHRSAPQARTYAPLDRPGPPLSVPKALLVRSLHCSTRLVPSSRTPVLLVPGTSLDPTPNFGWNYERAFSAQHRPWCAVTLPDHATGDIQAAGEYVVHALRAMSRATRHRIDVLGFSQGGMVPRWALRFWPDTRRMVSDLVALDPSNHGTLLARAVCQRTCDAANWQQSDSARFIAALNSYAETFAGIDYTVVFSHMDEIVVPNLDTSGSSSLHTGRGRIRNIAVQDICPADSSDHLAMGSYDAVGYALVMDALDHPGPADPSRIPLTVCAMPLQPGVDAATFPLDYGRYWQAVGANTASAKQIPAEPPLASYVFSD